MLFNLTHYYADRVAPDKQRNIRSASAYYSDNPIIGKDNPMHKNKPHKHGMSHHKLYVKWKSIKRRCLNPNSNIYKYYGGIGITMYKDWINRPTLFIAWCLNNGYKDGLTIDRIDNNGNYDPSNCRFVTNQINSLNKRLLQSNNTSGYRGVSYRKDKNKWSAEICKKGEKIKLGYFKSAGIAALRYDVEAFLLDDGRPMNFIERLQ